MISRGHVYAPPCACIHPHLISPWLPLCTRQAILEGREQRDEPEDNTPEDGGTKPDGARSTSGKLPKGKFGLRQIKKNTTNSGGGDQVLPFGDTAVEVVEAVELHRIAPSDP